MPDTPRIGPIIGADFTTNISGVGCNSGTPYAAWSEGKLVNDSTPLNSNLPSDGVFRPWSWVSQSINTGGYTPVGTYGILVPTTGWYSIYTVIGFATVTTAANPIIWLRINTTSGVGATVSMGGPPPLASFFPLMSCSANNVHLIAGDIVQAEAASINCSTLGGNASAAAQLDIRLVST